jgi:hypothetical protein
MRKTFADRVYEALGPDIFRTQKALAIRTSIRRSPILLPQQMEGANRLKWSEFASAIIENM